MLTGRSYGSLAEFWLSAVEMTWFLQAQTISFFFFFQEKDGIRDTSVTGVQTCALPIYRDCALPRCSDAMEPLAIRRGDSDPNGHSHGPQWIDSSVGADVPCRHTHARRSAERSWLGRRPCRDGYSSAGQRRHVGEPNTCDWFAGRGVFARHGANGVDGVSFLHFRANALAKVECRAGHVAGSAFWAAPFGSPGGV